MFEASATIINAGANMTTMVDVAADSGDEIILTLDLRLGKLNGNKTNYYVTQIIKMARFNDNRIRVLDIVNGAGTGVSIQTAGVSDKPTGNNQLEFNAIHDMDGAAFHVTSGTNAFGFTGNTVRFGQIINNGNGFILGSSANQNAVHNLFIGGPVEGNANYGIYDYCGANFWNVNNTNLNGIKDIGCPSGMNSPSTFNVNVDPRWNPNLSPPAMDPTFGMDAAVISQHYVLSFGRLLGQY